MDTLSEEEWAMARKVSDCRRILSDVDCSLAICGEEDEVLRAAEEHVVAFHGVRRGQELRDQLRASLIDEGRYLAEQTMNPAAQPSSPAY